MRRIGAEKGTRLFSLNVRYALSRRTKRFERIHKTLTDDEASQFFWFYNNGITMLADSCKVVSKKARSLLIVENPQVVNGCQTVSAF
ncbi:MAG: AIPR family protein, partial [Planctomycetota bacterium]|nr:AIPR family protein [Planctomycetota bacterium]